MPTEMIETRSVRIPFEDWLSQTRGISISVEDVQSIRNKLPSSISLNHALKRILLKEIKNILMELNLPHNPFHVIDILLRDVLDIPDEIANSVCHYYNNVANKNPEEILKFPYVYIYNKFMYQNHPDHIMQHNITPDKLKSLDGMWGKLLNE